MTRISIRLRLTAWYAAVLLLGLAYAPGGSTMRWWPTLSTTCSR
jgi:hypothetical protein